METKKIIDTKIEQLKEEFDNLESNYILLKKKLDILKLKLSETFEIEINQLKEKEKEIKDLIWDLEKKKRIEIDNLIEQFKKENNVEKLILNLNDTKDEIEFLKSFNPNIDITKMDIQKDMNCYEYNQKLILDSELFYQDEYLKIYAFYIKNNYRKKINIVGVEFWGVSNFNNVDYTYSCDLHNPYHIEYPISVRLKFKDYKNLELAKKDIQKNKDKYFNSILRYRQIKNKLSNYLKENEK